MPSVTFELSSDQWDQVQAYAALHEIPVEEVICRALEHFLALARTDSGDVDLVCRDRYMVHAENYLKRLDDE